jgi:hypothetical protein
MNRRKEEAEVIVRLDYIDGLAHITVSSWPAMARKLERRYGKSLDGNSEQSRRWRVPLNLIAFMKPPKPSRRRSKRGVVASHYLPHLEAVPEEFFSKSV